MENLYDMNALYLYKDGYRYRVGKIEKINEKTVRMESGVRILKEEFENIYKLTDEETSDFKGELVKRISSERNDIKQILGEIRGLESALRLSMLASVDTSKLQSSLNELADKITMKLNGSVTINSKEYVFNKWDNSSLEAVDEIQEDTRKIKSWFHE